MANSALVKLYNDLKKLINNRATQITRDFNSKLSNLRIGEENLAANAVTARAIAAETVSGYQIKAQTIESRHLTLSATSSLAYPNRNYIRYSDVQTTTSNYLIKEYETTELIYDLDYTIVIYGLLNAGQQIMLKYNDGADGTDSAYFDENGYAVIHTHTPMILSNENIRFYNYPSETATTGSIGWVCLYRGDLDNPPLVWNVAPEDIGVKIKDATSSIELLGDGIEAKVSNNYLDSILRFDSETGVLSLGQSVDGVPTNFEAELSTNKLSFKNNNNEIAYFSATDLNINSAKLIEKLEVGTYTFAATPDGGVVFR